MENVITVGETIEFFGFDSVYNVQGIFEAMRGLRDIPHHCGAISALVPGKNQESKHRTQVFKNTPFIVIC